MSSSPTSSGRSQNNKCGRGMRTLICPPFNPAAFVHPVSPAFLSWQDEKKHVKALTISFLSRIQIRQEVKGYGGEKGNGRKEKKEKRISTNFCISFMQTCGLLWAKIPFRKATQMSHVLGKTHSASTFLKVCALWGVCCMESKNVKCNAF